MRGVTATRWGWIAAVCVISNAGAQPAADPCDVDTRSIGDHRFVPIPAPVDFGSAFAPSYFDVRLAAGMRWMKTSDATGWTLPALTSVNGGLQFSGDDVDVGIAGGLGMGSALGNVLVDLSAGYAITARLAAGPSFRFGRTRLGVYLGWAGSNGHDVSLRSYLEDQLHGNGPPDKRVATALVPTGSDDWSASIAWATVVAPWLSLQGAWRMDYVTISRDLWMAKSLRRETTHLTRLSSAIAMGPSFSRGKFVVATAVGLTLPRLELEDPLRRIYTLNFIGGVEPSWLLRSDWRVGLGIIGQAQLRDHHDGSRVTADEPPDSAKSDADQETVKRFGFDVVFRIEKVF